MATNIKLKKICLIGDFGVGKTSLFSRYTSNIFSEEYLSTVGTKVEHKILEVDNQPLKLLIWDIAGSATLTSVKRNYLIGASAYILVVDRTRKSTLKSALSLKESADAILQSPPSVIALNKSDLTSEIEIADSEIENLNAKSFYTSALTGENVDALFEYLARQIV